MQRLIGLAADLQKFDVPIACIDMQWWTGDAMSLRELAGHVAAVNDADLNYPIIFDENGCLLDGRHRIVKAMLEGRTTINAVRFDQNPVPCSTGNEE